MRINICCICDAITNIKLCTNRAEILYNQNKNNNNKKILH